MSTVLKVEGGYRLGIFSGGGRFFITNDFGDLVVITPDTILNWMSSFYEFTNFISTYSCQNQPY